jgi:hypothetical protein
MTRNKDLMNLNYVQVTIAVWVLRGLRELGRVTPLRLPRGNPAEIGVGTRENLV